MVYLLIRLNYNIWQLSYFFLTECRDAESCQWFIAKSFWQKHSFVSHTYLRLQVVLFNGLFLASALAGGIFLCLWLLITLWDRVTFCTALHV